MNKQRHHPSECLFGQLFDIVVVVPQNDECVYLNEATVPILRTIELPLLQSIIQVSHILSISCSNPILHGAIYYQPSSCLLCTVCPFFWQDASETNHCWCSLSVCQFCPIFNNKDSYPSFSPPSIPSCGHLVVCIPGRMWSGCVITYMWSL